MQKLELRYTLGGEVKTHTLWVYSWDQLSSLIATAISDDIYFDMGRLIEESRGFEVEDVLVRPLLQAKLPSAGEAYLYEPIIFPAYEVDTAEPGFQEPSRAFFWGGLIFDSSDGWYSLSEAFPAESDQWAALWTPEMRAAVESQKSARREWARRTVVVLPQAPGEAGQDLEDGAYQGQGVEVEDLAASLGNPDF